MKPRTSLLCVTRKEPHTPRFIRHMRMVANVLSAQFVVVCDRCDPEETADLSFTVDLSSRPVIETALEEAVRACGEEWILRIDDDETCSLEMIHWLAAFEKSADVLAVGFPRAHLILTESLAIVDGGYWPDIQVRFTHRDYAVRREVHEPPSRLDTVAPAMLLHHLYLVRTKEERREAAERYSRLTKKPMVGDFGYWPEDDIPNMKVRPVEDGAAVMVREVVE